MPSRERAAGRSQSSGKQRRFLKSTVMQRLGYRTQGGGDSHLAFSVEAEKDSDYRYSAISVAQVLDAVGQLDAVPNVTGVRCFDRPLD